MLPVAGSAMLCSRGIASCTASACCASSASASTGATAPTTNNNRSSNRSNNIRRRGVGSGGTCTGNRTKPFAFSARNKVRPMNHHPRARYTLAKPSECSDQPDSSTQRRHRIYAGQDILAAFRSRRFHHVNLVARTLCRPMKRGQSREPCQSSPFLGRGYELGVRD